MSIKDKNDLDQDNSLSSASKETSSLDAWINQHLFEKEERMRSMSTPNGASPFNWHKPSANDGIPSKDINLNVDLRPTTVEVVDLNEPLEYISCTTLN